MTVRWGVIGVGDIANKRVAAAIQSDERSELVAVCRRSKPDLDAFADQYGVLHRFTNANDLIACPDVEAVYIATPVDCHAPQTIQAAKGGKHVLVEKPMALDPDECARMIGACKQAGVMLGVAYYRRFYPAVLRAAELIRGGQLGRVLSVACVTGNPNRFPADDWRVVLSRGGGGPLMDIGSHRLDVFNQLMGDVDCVKASVTASSDYEAEQAASVLLQFRSGALGVLQCYFGTVNTPDRLEIIGTDGRVTIEDLNQGDLLFVSASGTQCESHPPATNFHQPLVGDFTKALIENRSPAVTGEIGKWTTDVIRRAYDDAI